MNVWFLEKWDQLRHLRWGWFAQNGTPPMGSCHYSRHQPQCKCRNSSHISRNKTFILTYNHFIVGIKCMFIKVGQGVSVVYLSKQRMQHLYILTSHHYKIRNNSDHEMHILQLIKFPFSDISWKITQFLPLIIKLYIVFLHGITGSECIAFNHRL